MQENPLEKRPYTEEEALTEAERLRAVVEANKGKKDYEDAEHWLKITKQEVRPRFKEEEFKEIRTITFDLFENWNYENLEKREREVESNLSELFKKREILIDAYKYKGNILLHDIVKMISTSIPGGKIKHHIALTNFCLDLLAELTPQIIKESKKNLDNNVDKTDALRALLALAECSDKEKQNLGLSELTALASVIERNLLKSHSAPFHFEALKLLRDKGTDEQKNIASKIVTNIVKNAEDTPQFALALSFIFEGSMEKPKFPYETMSLGFTALYSFLKRHQLPLDMVDMWVKSGREGDFSDIVAKNVGTIIALNKERPGASKFLYKEFGIADFGRYPVQMLLKQYDEADDLKNPYGVIIYPRDDYNGVFYENKFAFEDFFEKIKGDFSIRIFECEGKIGVARALLKLDKKYNPPDGKGHKISLAIIGGHGEGNSIQFGGDEKKNSLYAEDLMGRGARRTSKFFEENPTVILNSCSTGVDKGIGQKLSEVMGAKVVAPTVPTNINEIQVGKRRGGKFRFNAKYKSISEIKNVYLQGVGVKKKPARTTQSGRPA